MGRRRNEGNECSGKRWGGGVSFTKWIFLYGGKSSFSIFKQINGISPHTLKQPNGVYLWYFKL